jgi:hypothetical protein
MYRLFIYIVCLIFVLSIPILAQEDEEIPSPPQRHAQAKIGGAGGFTQNLLFLNLDPINEILKNSNAIPFKKNPMLLLGGQGYGYIMVVPNLRIGGLGAGGSMIQKSLDTSGNKFGKKNVRRDVELSVGFGGVTVEYAISVIPQLDVALGLMLGGGSTSIRMTRNIDSEKMWGDVWDEYGSSVDAHRSDEYTRNLSGSFFIYQPSLNIEYAVLRWVGLRLGVSYNGMMVNKWTLDDKYDIIGVPDKISGKGFMINGGIFLGTFLY